MNKYIKSLAVGLTVLGLNTAIIGQEENQPEPPTQVTHTLTSTPDARTTLNEDLAGKVRKLAELVMTKEKGTFKKKEEDFGTEVVVQRFAVNETKGYELLVYDDNNKAEAFIPEDPPADLILIVASSLTENNERKVYAFLDRGLDGNVNGAEHYVAPSSNLFSPEGLVDWEFEESELNEVKTFDKDWTGEITKGAEYQEEFQREYERVLDELIRVYEQE
ncbi:hypothetical protein HY837_02930 [archaeon]|nr:hypothetical protein [archaeon]